MQARRTTSCTPPGGGLEEYQVFMDTEEAPRNLVDSEDTPRDKEIHEPPEYEQLTQL